MLYSRRYHAGKIKKDDYEGNSKNADDYIEEFAEYMNKYADDVYELIEIATEITDAK